MNVEHINEGTYFQGVKISFKPDEKDMYKKLFETISQKGYWKRKIKGSEKYIIYGPEGCIIECSENCIVMRNYRQHDLKNETELQDKKIDISQIKFIPYINLSKTSSNIAKFFDENGIFQTLPIEEAYGKVNGIEKYGSHYYSSYHYNLWKVVGDNNPKLISKAVAALKPGDDFDKFIKECKRAWFERFVAKVDKISIERETDNLNNKTFDFVRVLIMLSDFDGNWKQDAKIHMKEIAELVIDKIKNSTKYKKYGVPVEFLKLSKVTLTKDKCMELLFELKEVKTYKED